MKFQPHRWSVCMMWHNREHVNPGWKAVQFLTADGDIRGGKTPAGFVLGKLEEAITAHLKYPSGSSHGRYTPAAMSSGREVQTHTTSLCLSSSSPQENSWKYNMGCWRAHWDEYLKPEIPFSEFPKPRYPSSDVFKQGDAINTTSQCLYSYFPQENLWKYNMGCRRAHWDMYLMQRNGLGQQKQCWTRAQLPAALTRGWLIWTYTGSES